MSTVSERRERATRRLRELAEAARAAGERAEKAERELRQAVRRYNRQENLSYRQLGEILGHSHVTIAKWITKEDENDGITS